MNPTAPTPSPQRRFHLLTPDRVHTLVKELFAEDLHAKRVLSLSRAVVGVLQAAALGVHAIGQGLALALGLNPKHALKQVDRLLSNPALSPWDLFALYVPFVLGERKEAVISLDWTEWATEDQATCAAHVITSQGRATPLVWKTVKTKELRGQQTSFEDEVLEHLQAILPKEVNLTLLADRGFGSIYRYDQLASMGWDYIIRFRKGIQVTTQEGETQPAEQFIPRTGRPKMLKGATVTQEQRPVGAVVCVKQKGMKDAWCLATNRTDLSATKVMKLYGRRFTIEESFRDTKDLRYGWGLAATKVKDPKRRDRVLFVGALAQVFLTLLGAAAEEVGLDKKLKASTVTRRTHSLLRQGTYWFSAIPTMPEAWLEPLMQAFGRLLLRQPLFHEVFGVI